MNEANELTKTKTPTGRPPAGLPRSCARCGVDVVRPGVLRPVPLCAKHYFEARRRAAGVLPRHAGTPTDATLAVLLVEVAKTLREEERNYLDADGTPQPHAEGLGALASRCEEAVAALARTYPSVRRSVALSKEGASNG